MEIYPARQLQMLLAACLGGFLFGGISSLLGAFRMLLLAHTPPAWMQRHYLTPLPLLHRPLGLPRGRARRAWSRAVILLQDLLFCVAFTVFLILVLYEYNDGVLRLSVPVLALLCLWAWHALLGAPMERINAYLAFFAAVLCRYLSALVLLPLRVLLFLCRRVLWRALHHVFLALRRFALRRTSRALCRAQCAAAEKGQLPL